MIPGMEAVLGACTTPPAASVAKMSRAFSTLLGAKIHSDLPCLSPSLSRPRARRSARDRTLV